MKGLWFYSDLKGVKEGTAGLVKLFEMGLLPVGPTEFLGKLSF